MTFFNNIISLCLPSTSTSTSQHYSGTLHNRDTSTVPSPADSRQHLAPSSDASAKAYATFPPPPLPPLPDGKKEGCVFCDVTVEKGFKIVYEDSNVAVFRDRTPGSEVHLLAVPKRHYDNVKTITKDDVPMVRELAQIGGKVLEELGIPPSRHRLGFHIPPFFSVNHLHLHLLSTPLPFPGSFKYRPSFPSVGSFFPFTQEKDRVKGWSWFVEVNQAIRILEAGKRVKVSGVSVPRHT
ncbi:HIT-like protein [Meredithblackwellia eburnea MCA 4105]